MSHTTDFLTPGNCIFSRCKEEGGSSAIGKVDVSEGVNDRVNDYCLLLVVVLPREGVRYDVLNARNVSYFSREFTDVGQLSTLPIRHQVFGLEKCGRKRFLIC